MKINFTLERFNSIMDELVAEAGKESSENPNMLLGEAKSLTAQFQAGVLDADFAETAKNIQVGFMLFPADSLALLLSVGYKMGQDDARAQTEIAELEKLFTGSEKV